MRMDLRGLHPPTSSSSAAARGGVALNARRMSSERPRQGRQFPDGRKYHAKNANNFHAKNASASREIQFVLPRRRLPSSNNRHDEKPVRYFFPGQRERSFENEEERPQQTIHQTEKSKPTKESAETDLQRSQPNSKSCKAEDAQIRNGKALIQSVEEAVKDQVGRRPRTNSTDGELNLPQRGLCDENIVLQTYKWDMDKLLYRDHSALPPPRGFRNLGNTCFMNATLQCLAYMPTLCQSITSLPTSCYDLKTGGKRIQGQRITMFLRSLLRRAHGMEALERGEPWRTVPIAPSSMHKAITGCKLNGHRFRPGRQEDAHELLIHLFDAMQEGELFAAGINPHASGWCDKLPIRRLHETTFVHRIFGGYFRSQLFCHKCGYKSNTYDPFLDLALEVSKKHIDSLAAAFKEFMRKEKLDQNNRWRCSGCKKHVCPTKHLSVFRPPLSLCIHLKRFEYVGGESFNMGWEFGHRHNKGLGMRGNGGSKISKKIDFPAVLSLPLSDGRVCQYLLTGVIIHVGKSATSGHYTAYVKQPGGSKLWYHMDDCHTETVSEKTVLKQRDAYVLFYTRKEVKLEFPSNVSRGGGKGAPPNKIPSSESPDNDPHPSAAAGQSPASDSAAIVQVNKANLGSSGVSAPSKGKLASMKRSLDYAPCERGGARTNNKRRAWRPPDAGRVDSGDDGALLLGSITVGNWDDDGAGTPPKDSLRLSASERMERDARSRKRKMRPEFWDAHIDEVRKPKRKSKD